MPIAKSPDEEFEYVLSDDRKLAQDKQTTFLLQPMPAGRYYKGLDNVFETRMGKGRGRQESRSLYKTGSQELNTLLAGIVGVRNFFTSKRNGNGAASLVAVSWPADGALEDKLFFLSHLIPRHRKELAEAIAGDSELGEDEVGESVSLSGSD